jgi:hypothetical protein
LAIKPISGSNHEETEVWIRARNLPNRGSLGVKFGDMNARIVEIEESLIVCWAPTRPDFIDNTKVPVTIVNISTGEKSDEKEFLYVCQGISQMKLGNFPYSAHPSFHSNSNGENGSRALAENNQPNYSNNNLRNSSQLKSEQSTDSAQSVPKNDS